MLASLCPAGIHKASSCQDAWAPTAAAGGDWCCQHRLLFWREVPLVLWALFSNRKLVLCVITSITLCRVADCSQSSASPLSAAPGFPKVSTRLPEHAGERLLDLVRSPSPLWSASPSDSNSAGFQKFSIYLETFPTKAQNTLPSVENKGPQSSFFFHVGPYLKTFLNLLQHGFCFMFSFLAARHVGS